MTVKTNRRRGALASELVGSANSPCFSAFERCASVLLLVALTLLLWLVGRERLLAGRRSG